MPAKNASEILLDLSDSYQEDDRYKSTVISLLPMPIFSCKPGLFPTEYVVPECPSTSTKPAVLIVGPAITYVPVPYDERGKQIKISIPSIQIARAIVADFIDGQMEISESARPGVSFEPGVWSNVDKLLLDKGKKIASLRVAQLNWFRALVKRADDDFTRYKRHTVVSDLQRFAAKTLGLSREWLIVATAVAVLVCPACTNQVLETAIVCPNCHVILKEEQAKNFKFAVQ